MIGAFAVDVGVRQRVPGFVWLRRQPGASVSLAVQQVDQPAEGRNRLHLDFGTTDADATARRIIALGGSELEQHEIQGFRWTVFADPEGTSSASRRPIPTRTPDRNTG